MQTRPSRWIGAWLAGVLLGTGAAPGAAQPYPSKQIEIIVPYAPGGTTDFVTRVIGQRLSESWSQPVLVVNRPGASGAIGADLAAQAAPDGHTLCITGYTNRNLLFASPPPTPNPARDLMPVAMVAQAPLLLLSNPAFSARDLAEFLAQAKSRQPALNYASIGSGSPSHLAMEMLKRMAGVDLVHVPYKGSGPALLDLMAGHVPVMFDSVVSASPHVRAGKLRALAVGTATRLPSLPQVPTVAESGLAGFEAFTWTALYAPAGTPADRVEKLRTEVARILRLPDVMERFASQGAIVPEPLTPAATAAFIQADVQRWRRVIAEGNIKAE
ncbi:MAG: tripartite tricarboxylate transporter substrate binding protein [Burkholderiales bacterium]|nr:tripartite tricarboxylate transporter substrate binding protein [Burkholderiales bacterium]